MSEAFSMSHRVALIEFLSDKSLGSAGIPSARVEFELTDGSDGQKIRFSETVTEHCDDYNEVVNRASALLKERLLSLGATAQYLAPSAEDQPEDG